MNTLCHIYVDRVVEATSPEHWLHIFVDGYLALNWISMSFPTIDTHIYFHPFIRPGLSWVLGRIEDRAGECDFFIIISVLGGEYRKSAYVFENRNHILIACTTLVVLLPSIFLHPKKSLTDLSTSVIVGHEAGQNLVLMRITNWDWHY